MKLLLKDLNWKNSSEVSKFVHDWHEHRLSDLRDHHREMWINILWAIVGRQDVFYDRWTKQIFNYQPTSWNNMLVISNLLFPQARRTVAKLARRPIFDVLPITSETDDINAAQVGAKLLYAYWDQLKLPIKFIDWLTWLATTGNAIFKEGWDTEIGGVIEVTPEERVIIETVMPGKRVPKEIFLGEAYVDVASPFSVFWESGVKLDESMVVLEVKMRTLDYIYDRWGIDARPEKDKASYDYQLINIMESANVSARHYDNCAFVYNLWTKDREVVVISDKVPYNEKNTYGDYPLVHCVEVPVPGSEHGMSTIRQNRSNQAQYNRTRSNIIQHAKLMCNPKWLIPRGGGITESSFTDRPGEKIEYNYPFKPEQADLRPIPSYYERILSSCKADMQDIGSAAPVSQARGEPNLRSGKAVLALQDADDLILGPVSQLVDASLSSLGRKLLRRLADNVTEERLTRIVGANRQVEIMSFTGKQLYTPNRQRIGQEYFDVRVLTYSTYPLSRVGMEERLTNLIQLGVLHPVQHREQILQMLGSGDLQTMFDAESQDRAIANENNYKLLRGEQVQVFEIENHEIAIREFDKFFKPRLRKIDPKILEGAMIYRKQHEEVVIRKQAAVMLQALQAQMPQSQGVPNG